jgi:site-specific DNA-cytosine methylase
VGEQLRLFPRPRAFPVVDVRTEHCCPRCGYEYSEAVSGALRRRHPERDRRRMAVWLGSKNQSVRHGPGADSWNRYAARMARISSDAPAPAVMANGMGGDNLNHWRVWWDDAEEETVGAKTTKPPYRVPTMEELHAVPWNGLKVVSTFSGTGGTCLGYRMAGYRVVCANDCDPAAQACYRLNHPGTILDTRDIREIQPEDILRATGLEPGELDVFEGSPPCTNFSSAGKRAKGWNEVKEHAGRLQSKVEDLFFEWLRLLGGLRPRAFQAENVAGLARGAAKGYFKEILARMKALGYRSEARMLDAQWLGVPQTRARVIFVGVREDVQAAPAFPSPLPYFYSVRDALPHLWAFRFDPRGQYGVKDECIDTPSPAIIGTSRPGMNACQYLVADDPRVVHDTHGRHESRGDVTDAPAPTIMGPKNRGHITVEMESPTGPGMRDELKSIDEPSSAIRAGRSGSLRVRIEDGVQHEMHDAEDRPSPIIVAGRSVAVEVQHHGSHGARGGKFRDGERPAPTIGAGRDRGRGTVRVRVETIEGNDAFEPKFGDGTKPSPTIMAGGPCNTSGQVRVRVQASSAKDQWRDGDRPAPCVGTADGDLVEQDASGGTAWREEAAPCGTQVPERVKDRVFRRKLTIPEVMALCSFPPDFRLEGSYAQQWARMGNAVPPVMAYHIARAIREGVFGK